MLVGTDLQSDSSPIIVQRRSSRDALWNLAAILANSPDPRPGAPSVRIPHGHIEAIAMYLVQHTSINSLFVLLSKLLLSSFRPLQQLHRLETSISRPNRKYPRWTRIRRPHPNPSRERFVMACGVSRQDSLRLEFHFPGGYGEPETATPGFLSGFCEFSAP